MIALPVPGTDTRVLTGRGPVASSCCAYAAEARTRTWPSGVSSAPTATAVCDPLCGSMPIITTATTCPFPHIHARREPRRACLITDRSSSHLLRATPTIRAASDAGVSLAFGRNSEVWGSVLHLLLNVTVLTAVAIAGLPVQQAIWRRTARRAARPVRIVG